MSELLERLKEKVSSQFGEALIEGHMDYDFPVLVVAKPQIKDILAYLKAEGFTYLTTLCGIHFPANVGAEFAMMYQLQSLERNERVRIKTFMSEKDIEMPTITDLWAAANWMEREAFDFYGFKFKGHPNLKRILNMDEMNYHPLRKEYPLEDASRHDKEDKYFGR